MKLDFSNLAPALAAWIGQLSQQPLIKYINETVWIFAIVETVHLVFLAILGGAVLALNLRLLGVALQSVPARDVERATRPWLIAGVAGTMVTGISMGLTTVNTLLPSAAFFVKMIALVAAILLSLAVTREVRREESAATGSGRPLAVLALLLWVASIVLFAATRGLSSGALLVALAGFVLFAAFAGRYRRAYVIGLGIIFGAVFPIVEVVTAEDTEGPIWLSMLPVASAFALAGVTAFLAARDLGWRPLERTKLAAFASTLAWVTVAAAGRWIGFS